MRSLAGVLGALAMLGIGVGFLGLLLKKVRRKAAYMFAISCAILVAAMVMFFSTFDDRGKPSANLQKKETASVQKAQETEVAPNVLYPMRGLAKDFAQDFNDAATKIGVSQRFAKTKCQSGEVVITCQYAASATLAAVATGHTDSAGMADNVSLLFSGEKNKVADFLVSLGIMMAVYAPEATKEERGVAIRTLLDGVKANPTKGGEIDLHGVRFGLSANGLLMATATDARNKR